MKYKNIILNTAMVFSIASIWTTNLHEFGHFVAAKLLHAQEVIQCHNAVSYQTTNMPLSSLITIAATGPLTSLILAILFHFICIAYPKRNYLFCFLVYMSSFCYISFFGYLCIAPFFPGGDTGFVFNSLGLPIWLIVIIAVAGGIPGYLLIKKTLRPLLLELASTDVLEESTERQTFIQSILTYPLFIGVIITTLLTFPVQVFLSVIYPLCSPFALFWGYNKFMSTLPIVKRSNPNFAAFTKFSVSVFIFFLLSVLSNRLLVFGLSW